MIDSSHWAWGHLKKNRLKPTQDTSGKHSGHQKICPAAPPQLEDSTTKVFHEQPEPHRRRPTPGAGVQNSRQPVQLALFLEHPLVRTGPCVIVITLLAACQTHAILQDSVMNAFLFIVGWLYCFDAFISPATFHKHFLYEAGTLFCGLRRLFYMMLEPSTVRTGPAC